ncbi:hypothetical protein ACLESO_22640, partial [Pyxidicoccus sp. 3LG]
MHAAGRKTEMYEEELLLALDEGLLSHEELAALRDEALRLERGPLELLKERGRLSEDTLVVLREELVREQPTPSSGAQPLEAATLAPATPGAPA